MSTHRECFSSTKETPECTTCPERLDCFQAYARSLLSNQKTRKYEDIAKECGLRNW